MLAVPTAKTSAKIPKANGTSPTRVVMNALFAEYTFSFSSHQNPMIR